MATVLDAPAQVPAQTTLDQYLRTTYHPDCEYLDGEVKERNVGKWQHARIQALIAGWFTAHEKTWQVMAATEQRVQVSSSRVRIPDIVVVDTSDPPEILVDPPLLIVEILSPADTYTDLEQRSADYQTMGVQTIWIIDPQTRTARICRGASWIEVSRLEVLNTPIAVDLSDIFPYLGSPNA